MEFIFDAVSAEDRSLVKAYDRLSSALTEASRDGYEPWGETDITFEEDADGENGRYVLVQKVCRPAHSEPAQPKASDFLEALTLIGNKLAAIEFALGDKK